MLTAFVFASLKNHFVKELMSTSAPYCRKEAYYEILQDYKEAYKRVYEDLGRPNLPILRVQSVIMLHDLKRLSDRFMKIASIH